jgi:hypothetical protein
MSSIHIPRSEESVPPPASPERPPLAPPDPAPQAAAWDRALRVIFMESTAHPSGEPSKVRPWRTHKRGRAVVKARH